MKKILTILFAACFTVTVTYSQTVKQMQEEAKTLLVQGNLDKAISTLNKAKQADPNDVSVLKDLAYVYYMKRDFGAAIEAGKTVVDKPEADQQSFQVLGLCYKAIADHKEAAKLYRTGLRKFPNSGVLYNEYGELFAMDKDLEEAIIQWEKGISSDPGYSSNYYNAGIYHARTKNWIRAILYGELFLNLESFSTRTAEMKPILFDAWKNLLAPGAVAILQAAPKTSAFEKEVLGSLAKASANGKEVTVESIITTRAQFLLDWLQEKQARYPFRLFDHQQYLVKDGLFEAYNYWLFSASVNPDTYNTWKAAHPKETEGFTKFQENRVFKIPAGQSYF